MPDIAETYNYHLVEKHESWTDAGPIVSRLPEPEIAMLGGRQVATVAEPVTLGLFGFATGTWIAGAVFGGFLSPVAELGLMPILILFAGIAQFIAGLYAFRRTDALSCSAFTCFGSYNTVIGVTILFEAAGLIPAGSELNTILGWFNCSFGFIAFALLLAALRKNMAMSAILLFLGLGYTLVGVSMFLMGPQHTVGGVAAAGAACLFASAFFAYYTGAAMVINSTWRRTLLPLFGEP